MKRGTKILLGVVSGIGLLVLAAPILLESPCLEFDGCGCGRQREWACFEFACSHRIRFMKCHVVIKSPGVESHRHEYWDAQYQRIGWLEFFRYLSSPINPLQPTRASARG